MKTFWTVYSDDPDMTPQHFTTKSQAQEWADGLCCGYYIEHIWRRSEVKKEIKVKVTYTDGYKERFTKACIELARKRRSA